MAEKSLVKPAISTPAPEPPVKGSAVQAKGKAVAAAKPAKPHASEGSSEEDLRKALEAAHNAHEASKRAFEAAKNGFEVQMDVDPQIGALRLLIRRISGSNQFRKEHPDYGDLNSTINLLDMLSDKKASFSNGKQPGHYRYFSASHPDPEQQGQKQVQYDEKPDAHGRRLRITNSFLEGRYADKKVRGYVRTSQVKAPWPGAKVPEAELGLITPERGIRVLTGNRKVPGGEVLPTNEIRELMFSVQTSHGRVSRASSVNVAVATMGESSLTFLRNLMDSEEGAVDPEAGMTLTAVFKDRYDQVIATLAAGSKAALEDAAKRKKGSKPIPAFSPPEFPKTLTLPGKAVEPVVKKVDMAKTLGTFKLHEYPNGTIDLGLPDLLESDLVNLIAPLLAQDLHDKIKKSLTAWAKAMKAAGVPDVSQVTTVLLIHLAHAWSSPALLKWRDTKKGEAEAKHRIESPVFPVSDAKGYEVIGTWRYGRGLDIEALGVFDVLAKQDPASLLDAKLLREVVNTIDTDGTNIAEEIIRLRGDMAKAKTGDAQTVLSNAPKVADLNRRVLGKLRERMTDQQIIDLGMARRQTGNPNQIDFDLRNWIAGNGSDGVAKLPINNAAYALADLGAHVARHVCSCKMAEADFLVEALGGQDFISVGSPDDVTAWARDQAASTSASWSQSQAAMRGSSQSRGGAVASAIRSLTDGTLFDDAHKAQDDAQARLSEQAKLTRDAFGGEE